MNLTPDKLRRLAEMGLSVADIAEVVEMLCDNSAESRRAADRERKRQKREGVCGNSADSPQTFHGTSEDNPALSRPLSPQTPLTPTHTHPENTTGARGTRIPDDWTPSPEEIDYGVSEGLSEPVVRREAMKFLDYWRNVPGAKGRKLSWHLTWNTWIRNAADRAPKPPNDRPHNHQRPDAKLEHFAAIGAAQRAACRS